MWTKATYHPYWIKGLIQLTLRTLAVCACLSAGIVYCGHAGNKSTDQTINDMDNTNEMCAKEPMCEDGIIRLSKVEVWPQYIDEYIKFAAEVGEVSLRTEPGVLTMYALQEKDNPCMITILETYSS